MLALSTQPVKLEHSTQEFLDAQDPEFKIQMTDTQVQIEANIALLAGADTSSNTPKWTIHLLILHPEIYVQAVQEVRSQFPADHVITGAEVRKHLPFVEACLYECLRVFPVVSGLFPCVSPPGGVMFKGHFIPAGTDNYANFSALGMNANTWKELLKFDPSRFVSNEEARRNFFGFSYDVRICPGRHMAWYKLHTIFVNMLEDYIHLSQKILDEFGYPKRVDSVNILITVPINAARDCRLVLTKHE